MAQAFIYALMDPRTEEVRYVGKAVEPLRRLSQHLNHPTNLGMAMWFTEMEWDGVEPTLIPLEQTKHWQDRERFWVAYMWQRGEQLLNRTPGGDGVEGPKSTEWRKHIGDAQRGKKKAPEHAKRISEALKHRDRTGVGQKIWSTRRARGTDKWTRSHDKAVEHGRVSMESRQRDSKTGRLF